ncbi:MAG: hypothetical protein ACKVP7_04065 [Hyphomicrobiaceae bacterium]
MSHVASEWAYRQKILRREKQILTALAERANKDDHTTFSGDTDIASRCSVSVDTVQRGKKQLMALGLISVRRRGGSGEGRNFDVIVLNLGVEISAGDEATVEALEQVAKPQTAVLSKAANRGGQSRNLEGAKPQLCGLPKEEPSLEPSLEPARAPEPTELQRRMLRQPNLRLVLPSTQMQASSDNPVDLAFEAYNIAASKWGFERVSAFTPQRRKKLERRLLDIGADLHRGLEAFQNALDAIPHNRFLSGKLPPRDGRQKPFRLSFDRLLQTDGNMGDVLAGLIDLHANRLTQASAQRAETDLGAELLAASGFRHA